MVKNANKELHQLKIQEAKHSAHWREWIEDVEHPNAGTAPGRNLSEIPVRNAGTIEPTNMRTP